MTYFRLMNSWVSVRHLTATAVRLTSNKIDQTLVRFPTRPASMSVLTTTDRPSSIWTQFSSLSMWLVTRRISASIWSGLASQARMLSSSLRVAHWSRWTLRPTSRNVSSSATPRQSAASISHRMAVWSPQLKRERTLSSGFGTTTLLAASPWSLCQYRASNVWPSHLMAAS